MEFVKLGSLAEVITVGYVGSMVSEYVEDGIPFLRSLNVRPYRFDSAELKYISEEFHAKIKKSTLKPKDVVVVRTGTPGTSCVIPEYLEEANCSDLVIIRCGDNLDPYFVSYYINSLSSSFLKGQSVGAVQKHFNVGSAKDLVFPKLSKRKQILYSNILRLIDEKIFINKNICEELQNISQRLYELWFLKFEFSDKKEILKFDSELNTMIPDDWHCKSLIDIAHITMGQSPEGSSYNDCGEGTIFYQGSTDFGDIFPKVRQYTTEPARMAKKGDILLSVRAPVGDMNIANTDSCIGRGLAALNSKDGFDGFLFYVMKYFKQVFDRRNSEGTTFGSITKNDLHSLKLAYPPKELLERYDNIVSKYNEMIFIRSMENQKLEELRDWLLPMLMNGQISIRDAEEHIVKTFEQNE